MEKLYKVTEQELRSLYKDSERLTALEWGGIDNWEYFGVAMHEYLKDKEVEDFDQLVELDLEQLPYERENS